MKPNVTEFIAWGLTHADKRTIPAGAYVCCEAGKEGVDPWHYLMGTIRNHTTPELIEERWHSYYSKTSWTEAKYRQATKDFRPQDYATDCQGLCDAWWTHEQGTRTDISANANYVAWCTDKGAIADIDRPYVIGEALFIETVDKQTGARRKTHVGWVCGFTYDGKPLVLEARGLWYGVVVTPFEGRGWTHRGIMSKVFDYTEKENEMNYPDEPIVFKRGMQGDEVRLLQQMLNAFGYKDEDGDPLVDDGKCGKRTMFALANFVEAHSNLITLPEPMPAPDPVTHTYGLTIDGKTVAEGIIE